MRSRSIVLSLALPLVAACGTARYAPPGELASVAPLRVSGRQGTNQRLLFGPYATSEVSRVAMRDAEVPPDTLDRYPGDYRFRQRYAFSLFRDGTKAVSVDCTAEASATATRDVISRMIRVLRCILYAPDGALRNLYVRSSRDEPLAGGVSGSEDFKVEGSSRVGRGRVSGTAGYTIARRNGTPVAAVDATNDGTVYMAAPGDDMLAAVAAALLLYQDPLQASERFGDR